MLDNIKMLLGIKPDDTSKDTIINYWINYYTRMVLKYCHITELNADLEAIIEQMVVTKLGGSLSTAETTIIEQHSGDIKSITEGDVSITFKDSITDKQTTALLDKVAIGFQGQLNLYRRLDY